MLLAGDIGGTKARLALFDFDNLSCTLEKKYICRDYENLISLIRAFLALAPDVKISSVCVGVAGPVIGGRAEETNIPWVIDEQELKIALKTPRVWVINDLEANAWGLKILKKEECFCINEGKNRKGNQALISAGTGLGEAGLYWDGIMHHPFACEGGHVDYAPTTVEEVDLLLYLKPKFDHVSYERVLCGSGLYQLYRFLVDTKREAPEKEIETLNVSQEPQKKITEKAVQGVSKTCERAVELFMSIYGAEAGNLALKFLSVGGVYIGGGIAPQLISFFSKNVFFQAFRSKGRFSAFLESIPVHVVLNDKTALLGAARYAQERQ